MTEPLYITDNDKPPEEVDFSNVDFTHRLGEYEFVNWQGKVINLKDIKLPLGVL